MKKKSSFRQIDASVKDVVLRYPDRAQSMFLVLREYMIEVASEIEALDDLQETLKWGEPSYIVANGSTVRIAWKVKNPDQLGVYFNCKTTLVGTFKEIYPDIFQYEGDRAITFNLGTSLPVKELKHCIELVFTYHLRKNMPLLGALPR